jgi:hypothetical protein
MTALLDHLNHEVDADQPRVAAEGRDNPPIARKVTPEPSRMGTACHFLATIRGGSHIHLDRSSEDCMITRELLDHQRSA